MLKAIIADDERWVCELITEIIDWNALGVKIIAKARDGKLAFDMISKLKPEIAIIDIRMPGMDGIEIVKKAWEMHFNTHFIIVSGFKSFEYAQNALRYGVEEYILKPIKKHELLNSLNKILETISEKSTIKKQEIQTKKMLDDSKLKLRIKFLETLMTKNSNHQDIETINKECDLNFAPGIYQIINFCYDNKQKETISDKYTKNCINKLNNIINNNLLEKCFELRQIKNNYYIINYSQTDRHSIKAAINKVFIEYCEFINILNCYNITLGIGQEVNDINKSYLSADTAQIAIQSRIIEGLDKIIIYGGKNYCEYDINKILSKEKITYLENLIEVLDCKLLRDFINDIFDGLYKNKGINPQVYYDIYIKIIDVFNNVNNRVNYLEEGNFEITKSIHDFHLCKNITDIKKLLLSKTIDELENYKINFEKKKNASIWAAIKFIKEKYNQTISLNDIANHVNLNPVYLSSLFKKVTGENISDYIITTRLKKAKHLLKDINYNISQISEMVGYTDTSYFCRLFKKKVGISPTNYRKIHI